MAKKDLRLKDNNPLAGTGNRANPTATRPPTTINHLKIHSEFLKKQKGQQ